MNREAQCIICKCGSVIAACLAPMCYSDKDWMKDVRTYSKMGYTIQTKNCNEFKLRSCKCNVELFQNNES